jgi:RNA-directed DNA polymerase
LKPESVSTKQERIAKLAAQNPAMAFTSLNHYLDAEWLRYDYECTRKDGAVGVDGQTAQEYAANLEQNLQSLMDRLKSGRYRALPVRRHYIDKSDGGKRALGIPSFEEKVAQRAITMLLEPIYEHDFRDCSFGFRSGRGRRRVADHRRQHSSSQTTSQGIALQIYEKPSNAGYIRAGTWPNSSATCGPPAPERQGV